MPAARRPAAPRTPAAHLPVARVVVDVPLPHLDRPFDYLVPEDWDEKVRPGCRVRVRFAGRLVDGWVLDRVEASDHEGRLAFLAAAVSPEPVLTPEIARLARAVADRWAGVMSDVVRLAVPPRHARVEAAASTAPPAPPAPPGPGPWQRYDAGAAFAEALASGRSPRAVWTAAPGPGWPAEIATAVHATLVSGRGAVVVVPDARDLARLDAALTEALGAGQHVVLAADLGPAERYRRWLAVRRGSVRAVVGTRSAAFAPVADLGLVAIWDDGDDLHAEPHAPYPHTRDVLVLRAHLTDAAALVGGHAVSTEGAQLLETGWARPLALPRDELRRVAPRVEGLGEAQGGADPLARAARLPTAAWRAAREALAAGAPVLVQVPRAGYQPGLACGRCRESARCGRCAGPLGRGGASGVPACRWCGAPAVDWRCPHCGAAELRTTVTGAGRTAEELGRAFPGVPVRSSAGDHVLATVPDGAQVVVATPGAEPVADGEGYGAVLLLDARLVLSRPELRAGEEAVRRWLNAAALARPGGRVFVTADPALRPVQALVRWDPAWFAAAELAERRELHFPPAASVATVTGAAAVVDEVAAALEMPAGAEVLGPVPVAGDDEKLRLIVRVPRTRGAELAAALKAAAGVRSARKADAVRIQLEPLELL